MGKAETYKAGRVTSFFAHHRLQQRGSKLLDARIAKDKKPPKYEPTLQFHVAKICPQSMRLSKKLNLYNRHKVSLTPS